MTALLPIEQQTDSLSLLIEVGGRRLPGFMPVSHMEIVRQVNRIPYARLRIADGDAALGQFRVSSGEHFRPGQALTISAGYHGHTEVVFEGVVFTQRVAVRADRSWLEVECRDAAARMTLVRRHRYFEGVTDSQVVEELLSENEIGADIAATGVTHAQLLQYYATDWDYMVGRLDASGQLCVVENGTVRSFVPSHEDVTEAGILFGTNLLELDAEFDARMQPQSISAGAWNPAEQSLQELEGEDPAWTSNGNLSAQDMASVTGRETDRLYHGGALASDALQAWANGALLRTRIAGSRGRARVRGVSQLKIGQVVTLQRTGDRFSGPVLITGIRHEFSENDWCTDLEFGGDGLVHAERFAVSALPAAGLAPGVPGLQIGVVTAIADDPAGEHGIRVKIPAAGMDADGVWARLATLDAGDGRGTYFRPELDDEVVLGFLHGDAAFPVVLGMLHSSARPPPEVATAGNSLKGYTSRSKLRVVLDDENVAVRIETPDGNKLVLSDGDGGITISDQNGNSLVMSSDGIEIASDGAVKIAAAGDASLEGSNLQIKGSSALKAEGGSQAELSSGGTLAVSGTLVQIN